MQEQPKQPDSSYPSARSGSAPTVSAEKLAAALGFHGRYGFETQDECAIRKITEREAAADMITALLASHQRLVNALEVIAGIDDRNLIRRVAHAALSAAKELTK